MVREKLTGEKPPASLAAAVDLWRPYHRGNAPARTSTNCIGALRDQKAFARLTRTMLNHLALGDAERPAISRPTRMPKAKIPTGENDDGEDQDAQQEGESAATEFRAPKAKTAKRSKATSTAEQSEDLSRRDRAG